MDERTQERASQLFSALSNPTRLRITELLCHNAATGGAGMSVNEICGALSLGQSATSQNLVTLSRAGVLIAEHQGTSRIYRMRGPRMAKILTLIEDFCHAHDLYGTPAPTDTIYTTHADNVTSEK